MTRGLSHQREENAEQRIRAVAAPGLGRTLRAIADGLIANAEALPRESDAARLLRDAATSLLDADTALEREAPPR